MAVKEAEALGGRRVAGVFEMLGVSVCDRMLP